MSVHIRELFDLSGQVAIVSGGNRNLGYDAAEALAEAGARVVVTSRDRQRAEESAARLAGQTGVEVVGKALEVTDEAGWAALVEETLARFGRIDILVNNAGGRGVVYGEPDPTLDPTAYFLDGRPLEAWRKVLDTNLTSVFLGCRAVAPAMKATRRGKIVNIASADGIMGRDLRVYENTGLNPTVPDYLAAKAGVVNLTRWHRGRAGAVRNQRQLHLAGRLLPQPTAAIRRELHPDDPARPHGARWRGSERSGAFLRLARIRFHGWP